MKIVDITFIIGILAGIGTWIACIAEADITQYVLAIVTLIAFRASDRADRRCEDID